MFPQFEKDMLDNNIFEGCVDHAFAYKSFNFV